MANQRDVLRRIKAVTNIQQITKAMKMVAVAKLRRAQERVVSARPYATELRKTLSRLVAADQEQLNHPLLKPREVENVAYVVMSGDRGMAGAYNINVIRKAAKSLAEEIRPAQLITIGRKGRDFFTRRGQTPSLEVTGLGEEPSFAQARELVHRLIAMYEAGEIDEVRLIYTEFKSAISQTPVEVVLLPIEAPVGEHAEHQVEHHYEPSAGAVLNALVPRFIETVFYQALLEASASEQGARMTAMDSATENAGDLIDRYTLEYNRARQAGITREISEIVGGAEALK